MAKRVKDISSSTNYNEVGNDRRLVQQQHHNPISQRMRTQLFPRNSYDAGEYSSNQEEILSLEDESQARSKQRAETEILSGSASYSENLTTLRNAIHVNDMSSHFALSQPREIVDGRGDSSNASIHSGSPIGSLSVGLYGGFVSSGKASDIRHVVSSSAPTLSSVEQFVRSGGGSTTTTQNSTPTNVPSLDTPINPHEQMSRDRRKKDIHNMIERRRRYNINDRIKELGLLLPKCAAEDMKLNKGTILKASCDFIRQLQNDHELMLRAQQQNANLEELSKHCFQRIQDLERQLQDNGLPVPPSNIPTMVTQLQRQLLSPLVVNMNRGDSKQVHIKQEPFEEISSPTPTSLPSAGFMNQLRDMQITTSTAPLTRGSFSNGGQGIFFGQANTGAPTNPATDQQQQQQVVVTMSGSVPRDYNQMQHHMVSAAQYGQQQQGDKQQQRLQHQQMKQQQFNGCRSTDGYSIERSNSNDSDAQMIIAEDQLNFSPQSAQNVRSPLLLPTHDPFLAAHLVNQMSPVSNWDQASFSPGYSPTTDQQQQQQQSSIAQYLRQHQSMQPHAVTMTATMAALRSQLLQHHQQQQQQQVCNGTTNNTNQKQQQSTAMEGVTTMDY